jgi:hypothetical protein
MAVLAGQTTATVSVPLTADLAALPLPINTTITATSGGVTKSVIVTIQP